MPTLWREFLTNSLAYSLPAMLFRTPAKPGKSLRSNEKNAGEFALRHAGFGGMSFALPVGEKSSERGGIYAQGKKDLGADGFDRHIHSRDWSRIGDRSRCQRRSFGLSRHRPRRS